METQVVIVVTLSVINRRLLQKLNQFQLLQQLQIDANKSIFNGNISPLSRRLCATEKYHMMPITNERQKLLFSSRACWTPATVNILYIA